MPTSMSSTAGYEFSLSIASNLLNLDVRAPRELATES
jgi:hypothetical protein